MLKVAFDNDPENIANNSLSNMYTTAKEEQLK